ncbi:MAG: peptidylprolyl isomerase [Planctomyces sp.]|nr:peptidylprolyl isomerase [Planctomyces sp.]
MEAAQRSEQDPFASGLPPAEGQSESVPTTGTYKVKFDTSVGPFTVLVHRDWAPKGAERFHQLVTSGFYNDAKMFRAIEGFMVQFGLAADPALNDRWDRTIPDDPVVQGNKRGRITFATSGANSRTTQVFINFEDNTASLDPQGFAAFGEVIEGMENVDNVFKGYGEAPNQGRIRSQGNAYLESSFPNLDSIKSATIVQE